MVQKDRDNNLLRLSFCHSKGLMELLNHLLIQIFRIGYHGDLLRHSHHSVLSHHDTVEALSLNRM